MSASGSTEPGTPPPAELNGAAFQSFCEVIARLRSPTGCPWDRVQTLSSIKPFTLEETYELLEAIDCDDNEAICEELGDLLLQVILDSQIAADEGRFTILDVISGITGKMIRRHPHVFGDATAVTREDVTRHWNEAKSAEKQDRRSEMDGLPAALPQLARASRLARRAARVGYDFPDRRMLFAKLREETSELAEELFEDGQLPEVEADVNVDPIPDSEFNDPDRQARVEAEVGDLLFVVANIARRWHVNPEEALRKSNRKFERRFRRIEDMLREQGLDARSASLTQMEEIYQAGKQAEKRLDSLQTMSDEQNRSDPV